MAATTRPCIIGVPFTSFSKPSPFMYGTGHARQDKKHNSRSQYRMAENIVYSCFLHRATRCAWQWVKPLFSVNILLRVTTIGLQVEIRRADVGSALLEHVRTFGRGVAPCDATHDACLIWPAFVRAPLHQDRKSTRLNSSHRCISYAVFC